MKARKIQNGRHDHKEIFSPFDSLFFHYEYELHLSKNSTNFPNLQVKIILSQFSSHYDLYLFGQKRVKKLAKKWSNISQKVAKN